MFRLDVSGLDGAEAARSSEPCQPEATGPALDQHWACNLADEQRRAHRSHHADRVIPRQHEVPPREAARMSACDLLK